MKAMATMRRAQFACRYFSKTPESANSVESKLQKIDFSNTQVAFASKSTGELCRAWLILYGCSFGSVVKRADKIYKLSLSIFGSRLTHSIVGFTLFRHFCAGVDERDIVGPINRLEKYGVGGILDYAAEAKEEEPDTGGVHEGKLPLKSTAQARVHEYAGEAKCDENAEIFKHAIQAVHNVSPNGFAAIKLSGLGAPALMERMSLGLVEIEALFAKLGDSKDASVVELNYEQFLEGWKTYFNIASEEEVRKEFDKMDSDKDGLIDIVDWMSGLTVLDLPKLVASCKDQGPLFKAALSEAEMQQMNNLMKRCDEIFQLAHDLKVRIMIDAEWVAVQPAIDSIVVAMQRKFNKENAVVFGTHQTYLIGSPERLKRSLERSKREQWKFGAKIVRGAYMVSERERAIRLGISSPVWPNYAATESNFHATLTTLIQDESTEVMVASHNEGSVEFVLTQLRNLNKGRRNTVYFGQLLGMADHLTFTLANHKFNAYKYIPYGPVDEVMPYLIRRTQENSTLLGTPAVVRERKMLFSELKRRLLSPKANTIS